MTKTSLVPGRFLAVAMIALLLAVAMPVSAESEGIPIQLWSIATVAPAPEGTTVQGNGLATSLVFDTKGTPYISYYAPCLGGVRIAIRSTDGTWNLSTVAGSRGTNQTSIAINPKNGYPAFTFSDTDTVGDLDYSYWDGTKWNTEVIEYGRAFALGKENSLRFDPDGVPHVAYRSSTGVFCNLFYSTRNNNGTWVWELADCPTVRVEGDLDFDHADTGLHPSLAFNASGSPFIAYRSGEFHGDLMLAEKINGRWATSTVDDANNWGNTGHDASLALDSLGNPHISYINMNLHDQSNNGIRYASRDNNGKWTYETVKKKLLSPTVWSKVMKDTSLVLDKFDRPYITSEDSNSGTLVMVSRSNLTDSWIIQPVDISNAEDPSIAISLVTGLPAISFHDMDSQSLKYATMLEI